MMRWVIEPVAARERAEERVGQRRRQQASQRTGTHSDSTPSIAMPTPETPRRSDEGFTDISLRAPTSLGTVRPDADHRTA